MAPDVVLVPRLYLGGWGVIPQLLPEYADHVKPQQAEIDSLLKMARQYLSLKQNKVLEAFDIGPDVVVIVHSLFPTGRL